MLLRCSLCNHCEEANVDLWRCSTCRGPFDLEPVAAFNRDLLNRDEPGMWRYGAALPKVSPGCRVSLGETITPLISGDCYGRPVLFKLDLALPTGSFKDRGSALLVSKLFEAGVESIVDDSSGNAAASLAAYAAAAGIGCELFVPATASRPKLAQMTAYGAKVIAVEEGRACAANRAAAAGASRLYASHNWHPYFAAGLSTIGFELWEQLGGNLPESVVVPAGQGSLVLAIWCAFKALRLGGLSGPPPRLYAVQAEAYCSLVDAWESGALDVRRVERGATVAEGIASVRPLRGEAVLAALRESRGGAVAVSDQEILDARRQLAKRGVFVEPTAAAAVAGLLELFRRGLLTASDRPTVVLTGHGLKSDLRDVVLS